MPTRLTSTLFLSIVLTTSACNSSMNTPDIKQNPHPQQHYELIAIIDAPGAFESVRGYAYYQVSNASCVPQAPLTGGRNMPNTSHDFELTRAEDGSYRGYFYLDQFQNEDYFGLGVCHMDLVSVGPDFSVHGQTFNTALMLEDVLQQRPKTKYFSKKEFFNQTLGGAALERPATDEDVVEHPDAYFPITVTVHEVMP